jgi:large subunit ribosomal protein L15
MNLHNLRPAKGAVHKEKRLGRGEASGRGGTSTKGNKGGQSRAGYKRKRATKGGQMPIQRRVPKRGFKIRIVLSTKYSTSDNRTTAGKIRLQEFSLENLYTNGLIIKQTG